MPLVDAVNEIDWRNEPRSIPLLEPAAWGHTMLGVLLAVSVLTSHLHDPTLFNQLSPSGGIHNALGVGGALIGGTLVELFGASALLLAWLVLGNLGIEPAIETFCLFGRPEYYGVSSSLARELALLGENIEGFVLPAVAKMVVKILRERQSGT